MPRGKLVAMPLPTHARENLQPGTLVRFHLVEGNYVLLPSDHPTPEDAS